MLFTGDDKVVHELLMPTEPDQARLVLSYEWTEMEPESDVSLRRETVHGATAWLIEGDEVPAGVELLGRRKKGIAVAGGCRRRSDGEP